MIIALLAILATVSVLANVAVLYLTGKGLAAMEGERDAALAIADEETRVALFWKQLCLDVLDAAEAIKAPPPPTKLDPSGFVQ